MALDELLEELGASPSVDAANSLLVEDVSAAIGSVVPRCVVLATGVRDAFHRIAVLGRFPVLVAVYAAALEVSLDEPGY